jgi:hypothetical protein
VTLANKIMGLVAMVFTAGAAQACGGNMPISFKCEVIGEKMLAPSLTAADVCAQFKAEMAKSLKMPLQDTAGAGDGWIKVAVTIEKNGVASAQVTRSIGGKSSNWPVTSLAVSDSAITSSHVATLAQSAVSAMNGK